MADCIRGFGGAFFKENQIIQAAIEGGCVMKDFCQYVDVFYGNGAVDHFAEDGLASKWFYLKALCGNTSPHAVYPFGKMSVGAYSGGYPTGYGTHHPSSCGGIKRIHDDILKIRGFSHLHQSGTGAMGYYYNYAITTPFYGSVDRITEYHEVTRESGRPGYYSAVVNDILCEVSVTSDTALHRYHFEKKQGRLAIDFSNDGLSRTFPRKRYSLVEEGALELVSSNQVYFSGIFSGIKLYFCAVVEGANVSGKLFFDANELESARFVVEDNTKPFGAVFDFDGDDIVVKLSYSTIGYQQAREKLVNTNMSFDEAAAGTYDVWNDYLSAIDIETEDEELKEKFYSNFYHSLIKPCDMSGEQMLGIKDNLVVDFATFWDQYKTLYPLIFMLYPSMGEKIVKAIGNVSRTLGKIPCSLGLTSLFPAEEQAKMLGIIALCDAHHMGIAAADKELIAECMERELAREDVKPFLEKGLFERYTHVLDTTEACLAVAGIADDEELRDYLVKLSKNWINAYDEDGMMSEKSSYYEGDRYTYSFRLQNNMAERIALAGGNDRFVERLDDYFGIYKDSLKQLTHVGADQEIINTQYHRFQGFNNECDMEAPYAYIYAGRHDRTCEIVHEAVYRSYTTGKGALPGNNDSGGLSSCFIWNVLGLFPASGTGEFLLGSPHVSRAVIRFSNGKVLEINGEKLSGEKSSEEKLSGEVRCAKAVELNGCAIDDFRIEMRAVMNGGELKFS